MNDETSETAGGGEVAVYEDTGGEVRVEVRLDRETVWLTQRQMAEVFDSTPENVLMHLRNIFASGELEADATTKEFLAVRTEGRRRVRRRLKHYNLDAIISVGYRVNTRRGVRFRQWATRTLHGHLVQGFTLNEHRLAERGLREARETLDLLARTLSSQALVDDTGQAVLDLIAGYADTWRLLLEYDEDRLPAPPGTGSSSGVLDHERAMGAIAEFRRELMAREQASALFGSTRGDALAAILGNIEQTMFGEPLYRSREEQARLRARDAAVDAAHARLPERDRPCGPAEREGPVGGVRDAGSPLTVPDGLAAGRTARGVAVEVTEQVGQFPQAFLILEQLSNDI